VQLPSITWDIDPVLLRIPIPVIDKVFELRYYSLIFVAVFLGGYSLLKWQIERGGGHEDDAGDFIVYGVVGVLGGARVGHVLFYDLDKFFKDPISLFKIWEGGLASHGAVVGLILAMYLFTKRRDIAFLEGSDRFAFSAALGASLVRFGNFFNSEIVGIKTDQTWGVRFPRFSPDAALAHSGVELPLRHPSQLYEGVIGLLVMLGLYVADRAWGKEKRPRGALIALFFALYFPARFLIEFVKEHQVFTEADAQLDMGQYLSIPGVLLGVYGLWWSFNRRLPVGWVRRDEYHLRDAGADDDYEDEDDEGDEEEDEGDEDRESPEPPPKKKSSTDD
jgi:phosphatidylglycerol---prolipoprotein diacylglyceryl transferase